MFGPCGMRASADQAAGGKYQEDSEGEPPMQRSEPWCCSDLDGIEDGLVRSVYRIAKCTSNKVKDPSVHLSLNGLMTTIVEQEPTSCDIRKVPKVPEVPLASSEDLTAIILEPPHSHYTLSSLLQKRRERNIKKIVKAGLQCNAPSLGAALILTASKTGWLGAYTE